MSAAAGVVVWLTGLPSSGKSTLAAHLEAALRLRATPVARLDGDEVRAAIVPRPGYDETSRDAFYETLARLAAMLAGHGLVVIVAATASRGSYRERARRLAPRFVEVFVDVPLAECKRRDAKGLYASHPDDLPGSGAPYEPPEHPEVTVHPEDDGVARVLAALDAGAS